MGQGGCLQDQVDEGQGRQREAEGEAADLVQGVGTSIG